MLTVGERGVRNRAETGLGVEVPDIHLYDFPTVWLPSCLEECFLLIK